jgi:cold shock CspA family protein
MIEGIVVAFDEQVGLGTIRAERTPGRSLDLPFHCTQVVDGSRAIDVGTRVWCSVIPGRAGRWEAGDVTPVP